MTKVHTYLMCIWAALTGQITLPKPETIDMPVPVKSAAAIAAISDGVAAIVAENTSLKSQVESLTAQVASDAETAAAAAAVDDTDTAAAIEAILPAAPAPVAEPAPVQDAPADPNAPVA